LIPIILILGRKVNKVMF